MDPLAGRPSSAYAATMDDVDQPRCPECLASMEVAGTISHPYWICPSCKVARLS